MSPAELIAFEARVARAFEALEIPGPVHLSGGNEAQLIEIFRDVHPEDWVFSTWRSHYHALLHGLEPQWLFQEIKTKGMNLYSRSHRFFSSAIVGGCLPIACGVAAAIKRKRETASVWCFIGDMAARSGIAHETMQYAAGHDLPLQIVIEDNGLSTDTPTAKAWGESHMRAGTIRRYSYTRTYPHVGTSAGRYAKI